MSSNAKAPKRLNWSWSAPAAAWPLMMTDVKLAGNMDGVELAHIASKYTEIGVIIILGKLRHQESPDGVEFSAKPWAPLDVIREAERMVHEANEMPTRAWPRS